MPSLPPTACRVGKTPAPCQLLSTLALILFSAERSCQGLSKHWSSETAAEGKVRGEGDTRDKSVYPCDDKGGRTEQDGSEESCSVLYGLTKHATTERLKHTFKVSG